MSKFIGLVSAYAYAQSKGYTGTEEEFAILMAEYASVTETAVEAVRIATESAQSAAAASSDVNRAAATVAQQAAQVHDDAETSSENATTASEAKETAVAKADEASGYAQTATDKAGEAQQSAQTATVKAGEAAQSASAAAESARTLTIDATLTQSGQAADAKVVGDEITGLKEDLNNRITASREFVVPAGTTHLARLDKIAVNIKSGESFGIIKNHGGVIAYYSDGTNSTIMPGNKNNDIITAALDIKELGVYFDNSSGSSDVSCFICVLRTETGLELYSLIKEKPVYKIERLIYENKLSSVGYHTFWEYGTFTNGGLRINGTIEPVQPYRVSSNSHIIAPYDLLVHVSEGFRWGYIPFTNETADSWRGWFTDEVIIPKNTEFVVQIQRYPEITSEIADVDTFINAITFETNLLQLINDSSVESPDLSNIVGLHFTWYYSNPYLNKAQTSDYPLSNVDKILVSKGTKLSCDNDYRYKYYLYGLDGNVLSATNEWVTTETVIPQDGYLYFSFAYQTGSTMQTIESLLPHFHIKSKLNQDVPLLMSEIKPLIDNENANKYDYEYTGAEIPTRVGRYRIEPTRVTAPAPYPSAGGITIESATGYQGFAYYNGVIIQMYATNACALVDYTTRTVIGTYTTETLHGNTIDFLNEFENQDDEFPLAIVSDGLTNKAFIVHIDRTNGITVKQNIVLPINKCGYYVSTMVDALENIIYSIGYTENNYSGNPNETNNMIIAKWDLNDISNNGDNTVTPRFIESFTIPFIITIQGPCYYNGLLYVVSSHYENTNTLIYVIDPVGKNIRNIISNFPTNLKTKEMEGIYFAKIDGDIKAIVRTYQGGSFYYLITFNS